MEAGSSLQAPSRAGPCFAWHPTAQGFNSSPGLLPRPDVSLFFCSPISSASHFALAKETNKTKQNSCQHICRAPAPPGQLLLLFAAFSSTPFGTLQATAPHSCIPGPHQLRSPSEQQESREEAQLPGLFPPPCLLSLSNISCSPHAFVATCFAGDANVSWQFHKRAEDAGCRGKSCGDCMMLSQGALQEQSQQNPGRKSIASIEQHHVEQLRLVPLQGDAEDPHPAAPNPGHLLSLSSPTTDVAAIQLFRQQQKAIRAHKGNEQKGCGLTRSHLPGPHAVGCCCSASLAPLQQNPSTTI